MRGAFLVLFTVLLRDVLAANDTLTDFLYTVAVVEYKPLRDTTLSEEDSVDLNAQEYITLLSTTQEDLELVLFPESTLGGSTAAATEVPLPFTEVICNSTDTTYKNYLKRFSCAAIDYNTTVVVNIIERENCTSNNATGFCPSSGIIYYNSDVAFNSSGGVIGRYHKWNLFGEYGKSPPAEVELVSITTKNNNTFGMFTCFDILFAQPPLNLTRDLGLKNILFPTMWFSELPFLTALQTQQMWAQENDVNFLSAGANNPQIGSGGTGIYVGKDGPLVQELIGGTGGSSIIVRSVPRPEVENNPYRNVTPIEEDTDSIALDMDSLYLITDPSIGEYTSLVLDTNRTTVVEEVCNGDNIRLCCEFNITISVNETVANTSGNQYTYHLTAFDGIRSYSGVRDGGIESCGVLACLNDSITSCGHRFSNYSEIVWPITFESITITADFTTDENRIQFPNSLLASIRPVSPQYTEWSREVYDNVTRRSISLTRAQNRLLTFGIFGRDFSRDGELNPPGGKSVRLEHFTTAFLVCTGGIFIANFF
ncbi:vanin-like protein 3 [Anoplophora glabripennis]|uniref:vanin-like protein 3 n=1 Tax=Anoplophora glabripennis TaxID=217634 RepID=UPI0008757B2F|nr:vanin-like protein 3 [Anoplophora glabripennis]